MTVEFEYYRGPLLDFNDNVIEENCLFVRAYEGKVSYVCPIQTGDPQDIAEIKDLLREAVITHGESDEI